MLVSEAISQAQALTGQVYGHDALLRWLSELDGQLAFDLYHADAWQPYSADDLGSELLIPFPWDGAAYVHHLEDMTYFSNGEYDRYANARTLAENALGEFRRFVQRSRQCCKCVPFERTGGSGVTVIDGGAPEWRYISAYAEAVKHGFSGTPEEWLESLVGEKGDTGDTGESAYEYAVSKGYTGTETEYATLMASYATVAQAAATSAGNAAGSATAAAGSAAAAATDRGLAQTARTGAETAQTAAETAQGKAEDAQAAAETARGKAEDAQEAAETAQGKAEDAQAAAEGAAEDSEDAAEDAEAWAVGQRGGVDVPSTDETFHNNAKYWAGIAEQAAGGGVSSFNGRLGAVTPQSGDYTAAMVGADVSGAAAAVQSNLNTHASNTVIHITAAERATWNAKQNALTFDDAPTSGSQNPVTSGGVHTALSNKQNAAENEGTVGQVFTKTATGASWQNADGGTVVFDGAYTEYQDIGHTTPSALSEARGYFAGASVGDYALFGGGYEVSAVVDAYNASLTRSTPTALSQARGYLAGASVGDYALFGGGVAGNSYSNVVDAYNASLTRTTPTALSEARYRLAGASVGDYALFGGGYTGSIRSAVVDAYDASLTRSGPSALSEARSDLAGASVGDYALFGGGTTGSGYSVVVEAYTASLTRTLASSLSTARTYLAGASVGNYALFGGGYTDSNSAVVDAYNATLTRTSPTGLRASRRFLAGASVGDYALFGGGTTSTNSAMVDAYDATLTRSTPTALSEARYNLAGASVGNYALFGGGVAGNSYSNVVDAYNATPQYVLSINIPPWSKYNIDGVTSGEVFTLDGDAVDAMAAAPFTGYIRRGFTLSGQI